MLRAKVDSSIGQVGGLGDFLAQVVAQLRDCVIAFLLRPGRNDYGQAMRFRARVEELVDKAATYGKA